MTAVPIKAEDYTLARGYLGSCRLTGQHPLFVLRNGFHLRPDIVSHLENATRDGKPTAIADMACGNGIWAFDIAKQYPEADIFGYDISPAQFPPSVLYPENVKLAQANLFAEDVPEDMKGKFDVIHVRLVRNVAPGIDASMMERTFRHFLQMLKPTGFVQWEEAVFPYIYLYDPKSADPTIPIQDQEMNNFWLLVDQALGGFMRKWKDWDWAAAMRQAGFADVEATKLPSLRSTLFFESAYLRWLCQEFIDTARKKVKGQALDLVAEAEAELNQHMKDGYLLNGAISRYVAVKRSS